MGSEGKTEVVDVEKEKKIPEFEPLDRFALMSILPQQDDIYNMKRKRQVREALSFDDEELKILNTLTAMSLQGQSVQRVTDWKEAAKLIKPKAVELGEWITDRVTEKLKELHQTRNTNEDQIGIYEIFVEDKK